MFSLYVMSSSRGDILPGDLILQAIVKASETRLGICQHSLCLENIHSNRARRRHEVRVGHDIDTGV